MALPQFEAEARLCPREISPTLGGGCESRSALDMHTT